MVYGTHHDYRENGGGATASFRDLDLVVESSCRSLKPHAHEFDGIVVTGISGLSVGAPVALRLQKPLLVVRKQDESSHGTPGELLGLDASLERLLFLDDFISSGCTMRRVDESIEKTPVLGKIVAGVRQYESYSGRVVATYEYTHDTYHAVA